MLSLCRTTLFLLTLLGTACVRADEARDVVARAIEAHGGESRLARTTTGHVRASVDGSLAPGGSFKVTWDEFFDLPRRYRRTLDGTNAGMPFHLEYGVNGKQGWVRQGEGQPQESPVLQPVPLGEHWHSVLLQLLHLLDKDTRLTYLGEEQQGGRTLLGVRAQSPQTQANVYFDKSTQLLARARRPLPNLLAGREMIGETTYEDYHDLSRVKYPMHMKASSGDTYSLNITVASIEFLDKIEERTFAKPEVSRPVNGGASPVQPHGDAKASEEAPISSPSEARWDQRLIVATLGMGALVGVVWLIVRTSRHREKPTHPS
jgi:hypothetical protein